MLIADDYANPAKLLMAISALIANNSTIKQNIKKQLLQIQPLVWHAMAILN
jgi:hypothetical protein